MHVKDYAITTHERETLENVRAIKNCLDYLAVETARADLNFAAHLISVASEALQDAIKVAEHVRDELGVREPRTKESNGSGKKNNGLHGGLA